MGRALSGRNQGSFIKGKKSRALEDLMGGLETIDSQFGCSLKIERVKWIKAVIRYGSVECRYPPSLYSMLSNDEKLAPPY